MAENNLRHFCVECPHCNIDIKYKEAFNHNVKSIFINCPSTEEKLAGCFIANYEISWETFIEWCDANLFKPKAKKADERA